MIQSTQEVLKRTLSEIMNDVNRAIDQKRAEIGDVIKMTPHMYETHLADNAGEFFFLPKPELFKPESKKQTATNAPRSDITEKNAVPGIQPAPEPQAARVPPKPEPHLTTLPDGAALRLRAGLSDDVISLAISPDGRMAVSGTVAGSLRLWDIATGRLIQSLRGNDPTAGSAGFSQVSSLAFSKDGHSLVSGSHDGSIKIWDVASGNAIQTHTYKAKGLVTSVAFFPDGKSILSGTMDKREDIWDVATGRIVRTFDFFNGKPHGQFYNSHATTALSPDGHYILSGSSETNWIYQWDVESGENTKIVGADAGVRCVVFAPDGHSFVVGGSWSNTGLALWDMESGKKTRQFSVIRNEDEVSSAAFSPDGKLVLTGGQFSNQTLTLFDVGSGQVLRYFKSHTDSVTSVAFSTDGRLIMSGSDDGTLKLWNPADGALVATFFAASSGKDWLVLARDGRFASSANPSGFMTIGLGKQRLPMEKFIATNRRDALAELLSAAK